MGTCALLTGSTLESMFWAIRSIRTRATSRMLCGIGTSPARPLRRGRDRDNGEEDARSLGTSNHWSDLFVTAARDNVREPRGDAYQRNVLPPIGGGQSRFGPVHGHGRGNEPIDDLGTERRNRLARGAIDLPERQR